MHRVIFILGPPGAGKGTQCSKIVNLYDFVHISAGDLLREERVSGSKYGELIEECIVNGSIVPVKITIELLKKEMIKHSNKVILIDGFPRNEDNLSGWNKEMEDSVKVEIILFFDCPETICQERALKRGLNSGRCDDNLNSFLKRFKTYNESTLPVIKYFDKKGLVHRIDSSRDPEHIFENVRTVLNKISKK